MYIGRLEIKQILIFCIKISSSSSSFIFYFVCQNHTKSRQNAYMPAAVNFHENLFLDRPMVESRGLVTRKSATSPTSACLVAGMLTGAGYTNVTDDSQTDHATEKCVGQAESRALRQRFRRKYTCAAVPKTPTPQSF